MPVPIIAAGIAAVGAIGGGVIGHLSQMSAADRAKAAQDKALQQWLKLNIPDPEKQKLALDRFVSAGELIPELEAPVKAAESEIAKITQDAGLKQSRQRALGALEEQGYGGESIQDAAAQEKALIESGAANRGRQQAIVGDLGRRGQLGGGMELAARLDAQQAEGDRLASQSLDMESQRRVRALNAIAGAGDLAGNMQKDEYAMQSDAAKAKDAINMFNTKNLIDQGARNTDRSNDASRFNLTNKQNIMNDNTKMSNFEQQYNSELAQQRFDNEAKVAAGSTGQYNAQAAGEMAAGQSAANMWGGIGQGIGKVGASIAESGGSKYDPKTGEKLLYDPRTGAKI